MNTYLLFLVGVLVGVIIGYVLVRVQTCYGTLKIDISNPEKEIYRICLDSLENLPKKKRISLKVDPTADLSQE